MRKQVNIAIILILAVFSTSVLAQSFSIKGVVTDKDNNPLVGSNVILEGTLYGSSTDNDGYYTIKGVPAGSYTLSIYYVGYRTYKEGITVENSDLTLNAKLEEDQLNADAIVVTGVFDQRSKMESSVAISVLTPKQLELQANSSAAEMLKNVPGVYVNSSLGEIRNTVYSRGVSVGSNDGASGFYYVSMQEDGLPVTNATYNNYGPDYFLRPDITLQRLEAVRGGTASILGNNAPGGIFNYVSKIGGMEFEAEARAKYGLEGNLENPFYRFDAGFGGPISKEHKLTYYVGGFYRQGDGARYPGYPMNNGGQIKGNISKFFENGSLMLYAKYLNDKNAWYEFLPTIGFKDPKQPKGVEQTNSVLIPPVEADFYVNDTNEKKHFDSRDKIHCKDISIGLNFEYSFGQGWNVDNKIRYSNKTALWNTTAVVYPFAVDGFIWYAITGNLGRLGTYSFQDMSGNEIASITQVFDPNQVPVPFAFNVNHSELPGQSIQPNSVFFNPLNYNENNIDETMDQFKISKELNNMRFTAGAFYAYTDVNQLRNVNSSGEMYSLMSSPRPKPTMITYTDPNNGDVYRITNPDGVRGGSGASSAINIINPSQSDLALFFGHNWEVNKKINLDWGIRYETITIKGTNDIPESFDLGDGGADGDTLTLYDNTINRVTSSYDYEESVNTFSFSAGLNYKFNEKYAVYGRYSQGEKAPDMTGFTYINSPASLLQSSNPIAQKTQQVELGLKTRYDAFTVFVTPFYSILSNVPSLSVGQEDTGDPNSLYLTPTLYNKYVTYGVELEGNYSIVTNFDVRAVATFQKSEAEDYKGWVLGADGRADDEIQDFSGNETDNQANIILRITPTYQTKKFFVSVDWSYMGERAANVPNAFNLPAYNMTNLNAGYNITPKIQLQLNINNLFDQNGVMGWSAPGGFPAALDRQGFTKEMLEANPDVVYSTLSLPPRAAFMTLNYKW